MAAVFKIPVGHPRSASNVLFPIFVEYDVAYRGGNAAMDVLANQVAVETFSDSHMRRRLKRRRLTWYTWVLISPK